MTIQSEVSALLQRKRPLTYQQIVDLIHKRHPECHTSIKTVQWYASRLRKEGIEAHVVLKRRAKAVAAVVAKREEAAKKTK